MIISWSAWSGAKMKYRLGALLLAAALLLGGCNPASRARDWATRAVDETWQARYRVLFHQEDKDLEMTVQESRGETLVLDIIMPGGSLRLEYGSDSMLIKLDEGSLEWQDIPCQIPYYTLTELALQIAASQQLATQGDWAASQGYRLKVKAGAPVEAACLPDWTLYVDEFIWKRNQPSNP